MADPRPGCAYCFETLDPQDKREDRRAFVRCANCGAVYHAVCLANFGSCLRCGGQRYVRLAVTEKPPPLDAGSRQPLLTDSSSTDADRAFAGIVVPASLVPYLPYLLGALAMLLLCCCCFTIVLPMLQR